MNDRHVALVVEDEPDMAAEIGDLLRSFGHDHIHVETLEEGKACLNRGGFCYVLLDLQIKADRTSIKPRVDSGMTLLHEIRQRFPYRNDNDMHFLPVIVISGHGHEPQNIIGAYNGGIDDFILKPLSFNNQDIRAKIRGCLERAGRNIHDLCHVHFHAASDGQPKAFLDGLSASALEFAFDEITGRVIFHGGHFLDGANFKFVEVLIDNFRNAKKRRAEVPYLLSDNVALRLKLSDQSMRQQLRRLRKALNPLAAALGITINRDTFIQTKEREGYRLNPEWREISVGDIRIETRILTKAK